MKIHIAFCLSIVALLPAVKPYAQSKADRKVIKQLQADISYLSSDDLEGRRTGSEGEHKAADYIEQRYKKDGIEPYKKQYRYPFRFVYGKEISGATQIKIGNNLLRMPNEGFPLPYSSNKRTYNEILPDIMEQGNIWMMPLYTDDVQADDPHFDCEKYMYDRCREAQEQGATGVLFYDNIGSKWAPVFNSQSEYETLTIPVAFLSNGAYKRYIQENNTYETYIRNQKGGLPVDLNIALKKSDRTGNNIAAYIDNNAKYTVVIGAHYDHLGRGEDGNSLYTGTDNAIHHGADDNASGTAALLAVADWLDNSRLANYNYLFINFSGEELGLLGSKAFVKDQQLDSSHIAYMINMDMVGRLNDSTHALTIGGVGTSPAWDRIISKPSKQFKIIADSSGVGPSDHTSFYQAHIPVLFFFTGTHKDYHKPSDEADKINYTGENQVIKYVEGVITDMDKSAKPVFTATKQNAMSRVNFKVTLGIMPDYSYQDEGVRVDGVSDNRPAMRAGLKEGDIITKLGDYKVQGMQSYMEALSKFNPGDSTTVTVKRKSKQIVMDITFDK